MSLKKLSYALLCLVLMVSTAGCFNTDQAAAEITVENVNLEEVKDGQYTGEYRANKFVKAVVEVEVKDHSIKEIKLVEHENGLGGKAEVIPNKVVETQTLEVDTVSGATVSSKAILKAIEAALKEGI